MGYKMTATYLPQEHMIQSILNLRDELVPKAFDSYGKMIDTQLAEIVWKLNSCLYKGYALGEVE
jgi:hypothetical protein